jgi:hypothetical protein
MIIKFLNIYDLSISSKIKAIELNSNRLNAWSNQINKSIISTNFGT